MANLKYSLGIFLAKLLKDNAKGVSLIVSLLVLVGAVKPDNSETIIAGLVMLGTLFVGFQSSQTAKKDLNGYEEFVMDQIKFEANGETPK